MGGTARQFNKMYIDYKKKFKKPIQQIAVLMPENFTDEYFVPPINAEPRFGVAILVPVIYTDHVPAAFSAMNKLVVVTFPFPQLTVCVSPLGLVIVRLFANIAPFLQILFLFPSPFLLQVSFLSVFSDNEGKIPTQWQVSLWTSNVIYKVQKGVFLRFLLSFH